MLPADPPKILADVAALVVVVGERWGSTQSFALVTVRRALLRTREPRAGEGTAR